MLILTLITALVPHAQLNSSAAEQVWPVSDVSVSQVADGLFAVTASGFNATDDNGIMLPGKNVMLPVPPGEDVTVSVVPSGVHSLGPVPEIARSVFFQDHEQFEAASYASLQNSWGYLTEQGTFRRAGFVSVRLNPVIVQDGELIAAENLSVVLNMDRSAPVEVVSGHEGEILEAVLGTSSVWREPVERTDESPFWGKPWARIEVDTAGVYQITGEMVPEAAGMPSASLAMITGRGRMMSKSDPEADEFVPREVPILVEDGGDGIFDESDRLLFYGRGLSWWEDGGGAHFNSMYDSLNTYWLTWGGEGGPFMEVLDGSLTGAPSIGDTFTGRIHMERNLLMGDGSTSFQDNYGWHRIPSSSTANYSFSTKGATGDGTMIIRAYCGKTIIGATVNVNLTASVNGTVFADTVLVRTGVLEWSFPVTGLKTSPNKLAIQVQINSSATYVSTDWFEVFAETEYRSTGNQCQVPVDRTFQEEERRHISWSESLSDQSFVCVALSDTAVVAIDLPGGKDFEFTMPQRWFLPVMWVVPHGDYMEPVSVSSAAPGRIEGTISSGSIAYIYPEIFQADMPLLQRGRSDVLMIPVQDIYDEFNGGVRDPSAVRAFFGSTVRSWSDPLDQLVLVGDGHWDPRNFISDPLSFMDIIILGWEDGHPIVSDLMYTIIQGSNDPQAAVSRLPVTSRQELQLIAQRSGDYSDISDESGTWQSVILGSADDERSPIFGEKDDLVHTISMERTLSSEIPERFIPVKNYLIFFDWNSNWKKPEARSDLIDKWSGGALMMLYLGHGSFDQIADEGLMFLEDANLMACGHRLPWAFFGSCDVGLFQNPYSKCIAENLTIAPDGGAIVSGACSAKSGAHTNPVLMSRIVSLLLEDDSFSIGEAQWLGILPMPGHYLTYIAFGDGSLYLAIPDSSITVDEPELFTSQLASVNGYINDSGLLLVEAWESAQPDSYFTFRENALIEYLSVPGVFYRGMAQASPDFTVEMFVPQVASTGEHARIRYFNPSSDRGDLCCSYPLNLDFGQGSSNDTIGPDIEMWFQGFRGVEYPSISGRGVLQALLSDQSGINLLPYPGNQLALYIDDTPVDVSDFFTYEPGSAVSGQLVYTMPELQPGDHELRLRAADNMSNLSWTEMTFHLQEVENAQFEDFFVYPTPAVDFMSFNWVQSSQGLVDISVFTITGRKIAELGNLSCSPGYNQHIWDLRDADGDPVAAGTYIYVVSAGETELTGTATVAR
ncbi:hypothetical protein CSA37_09610 [Candidatus Fermentibacteria bacterium]|nr:MAG: hypothetical protein CSA37_09610 [Candidatus Fermentibacteria bacterium]